MESLKEHINQLIENTLKMETKQEEKPQDIRLQKMIQEAIDSCNQSQPYSEEHPWSLPEEDNQLEKNLDFYPTKKWVIKRQKIRYTATRIKYSPTRVKSRNFLSNISYTSIISKGDFYNENFMLDVNILLIKNLNPFSLQRKTSDK